MPHRYNELLALVLNRTIDIDTQDAQTRRAWEAIATLRKASGFIMWWQSLGEQAQDEAFADLHEAVSIA